MADYLANIKSLIFLRILREQTDLNGACGGPVSLPMATADWPAATAEAEPPDEPPGTRSVSQGFRVTCLGHRPC